MDAIIHANNVPWQKEYLPWFIEGFRQHNITAVHTDKDAAVPDMINVVFANNSWKKTVHACNMTGIPVMTVNRCFFGDRHDMVAIGWKGFNGDADFQLKPFMPGDRWQKHGFDIPEWNYKKDGYILVCGEFRDMANWYRQLDTFLPRSEVRFRPHPMVSTVPAAWSMAPGKRQDDIETALKGARVCVTFDSIAGCDSALAGVPTITYGPKSMAWEVSYHTWEDYQEGRSLPQQYPWACKLAYCQWSHDEIRKGDFWGHLRTRLAYPFASSR